MAERASALSGHYQRGNFGKSGEAGVILSEVPGLVSVSYTHLTVPTNREV